MVLDGGIGAVLGGLEIRLPLRICDGSDSADEGQQKKNSTGYEACRQSLSRHQGTSLHDRWKRATSSVQAAPVVIVAWFGRGRASL